MVNDRRDPARCDGVTRRDVLRLGSLTALGLSVGSWATLRAASARPTVAKATSCILIWLDGGPEPSRDVRPQARGVARGARAVLDDRDLGAGRPHRRAAAEPGASARPRGDHPLDDVPARRAQPGESLPADRLSAHAGTRLSELRRGHGSPEGRPGRAAPLRRRSPVTTRPRGRATSPTRAGRSPSGATPRSPGSGSATSTPSRASPG